MFRCLVGLEVRQPLEKFFAACCAEDFAAVNLLALRENLGDASFYGDFDICGLRVHSFA
jgi:hypothetical protein